MALPTSGPISASMINEELGNTPLTSISFETIAAEYNLSGPNYADSTVGLGLDELYGLNPAAGDFLFSDAYGDVNDTGWTFNNVGRVNTSPSPDEGTNSSITYNGVFVYPGSLGDTFPTVFTSTTRDADVVVTIPQYDAFSQTYNNFGGTVSGTVFAIQGRYQLQIADVSTSLSSINSQTGVVSYNAGNDSSGPGSVTQTFTKSSPNATTNLSAGEVGISATSYSVLTGNARNQRAVTFSIGVPNGAPDGVSGHQYGNVGSTLSKTSNVVYQYSSASIEAGNETGVVTEISPGLGLITFDYDDNTYAEGKLLDVDIITGYNTVSSPMPWNMYILSGSKATAGSAEGGLIDPPRLKVDNGTADEFIMGGLSGNGATGSGQTSIKVYPDSENSTSGIIHRYIKVTTTGNGSSPGGVYYINVNQNPNITFTVNPTTISQFTVGAQNKTVALTTGLAWTAGISGTGFTFTGGASGTGTTTFTVSAATNSGGIRTGVFTLTPAAAGYSSLTKTFNFSQAGAPVNSTVYMNIQGTWFSCGTALSPINLPIVLQQSSSSPYGFTPNFWEFALKSDYAQTYGISLDSTTYLSIGTSNTGGSSSATGVNSITSTPSSAQLYIRNDYSPGQYADTIYRDTVFTITNSDLSTHSFTVRLRGSGTGGGTPPSPPPTPPPTPPGDGGGCLIYGTQVSMMDGTTKEIQNLVIGDIVKSINIDTMADGESESLNWSSDTLTYTSAQSEVVGTTEYSVDTIYSFNTGLIEASMEHNHFIKRNNTHMFLRSDNIQVGDYFLNDENVFIEITSIEQNSDSNNFVYKIDVETKDLFFGNGILTHNAKGVPGEDP